MWFPLSWSSGSPMVVDADVWSVDVAAGKPIVVLGVEADERGWMKGRTRFYKGHRTKRRAGRSAGAPP